MALAETAQLAVRIDLEGNASAGIAKLNRQVKGLGTSTRQIGRGFGQIGAGIARAGLFVGGAAVAGLAAAAKAGGDFEAQLRTINTIARETDEGLELIGDGIRKLAREGRGDLADLSEGYYDILSAGIAAADAQGVLNAASTLAIGGLSTNAQAVDLLTTAINAYGQEASEATADADLFAKAIEIGKVTADEIAGSFANVAPIAAQMGIEIEEIAAAYAALTAQGTQASEVTTQMQRAIIELLDPSKSLLALQEELGVSFLKIAQDKGLVVALQAMRDAVNDDEEAFKALFGRVEGYKFALQTTGPQQKIYNDALAAMGDSAGTAAEQMAERQQGLNYQLQRLKANLLDAGLELSAGFLPALTRSLNQLSGALGEEGTRSSLRAIGEDIGKAIDGIDWKEVLDGAKQFVTVLKGTLDITMRILEAINKLPTELKAAAAAFLVVNKLSGGLVGAGVGNVVGGLAGAATQGLASRAPGIGKLFAQPVFVTNWPVGGMAGGAAGAAAGAGGGIMGAVTKAISIASIVTSVAAVIATQQEQSGNSTNQAAEIKAGLDASIAGKTMPQLQTALAGVNQGITDLQSNPLHALVQGEALTTLQQMRADLTAQIQRVEALKDQANRTKDDTVAASNKTTTAANETKREASRGLALVKSATNDGASRVASAVRQSRPIITTNVKVVVTAAGVSKSITTQERYGPGNGSSGGGSGGGAAGHGGGG